jgi:pyruvate kinase
VANAVLDGADAVMLSGETSVGAHPVEVIKAMNAIITEVEKEDHIYYSRRPPDESDSDRFISDHICYNACRLAKRTGARAIVTMSYSGYTAYKVSGQRPRCPIIVFTGNKAILGQVSLAWGVTAYPYTKMISTDHTISDVKRILQRDGRVVDGDLIIHIASMPIGESGMTNMLKLERI